MRSATSIVSSATVFFLLGYVALAQEVTTGATCMDTFDWASNSLDQSPCLVASYLLSPCSGGSHSVPPLEPNQHYVGPTELALANDCQCNTVTYSLLAGCGSCQNRTALNWSTYSYQCKTIHRGSYPLDIPSGTAVPAWAFLDTFQDTFNLEEARRVANGTDSRDEEQKPPLPPPAQTSATEEEEEKSSTSESSASETASLSSSPPPPPDSTPSSASRKFQPPEDGRNDKIVGGVLGGAMGLAMIVGTVFIVLRHRKRKQGENGAQSLSSGNSDEDLPETKQVTSGSAAV